jgi:hypothetical protein
MKTGLQEKSMPIHFMYYVTQEALMRTGDLKKWRNLSGFGSLGFFILGVLGIELRALDLLLKCSYHLLFGF